MLTPKDVDFYGAEGYVVVRDVLTPAELERLRTGLARFLDGAGEVDRNDDVYDLEDSHTRANPRVRRIKAPHKLDPAFHDLIGAPKLLDLMRPLLGPSIRLQNSKLNLKSAGYGAAVEWHQDWAYYPYTNDDVLAVGVLLDEFAEDNGAMMVIPGSHRGPVHDHHVNGVFCGGIDPTTPGIDFASAVPLYAPAGSITLHHARTIHGSALNRSGRSRNFLLYEAAAGDAWPLAGQLRRLRRLRRVQLAPSVRRTHDPAAHGCGAGAHAAAETGGRDFALPGAESARAPLLRRPRGAEDAGVARATRAAGGFTRRAHPPNKEETR